MKLLQNQLEAHIVVFQVVTLAGQKDAPNVQCGSNNVNQQIKTMCQIVYELLTLNHKRYGTSAF